MSKTKQTTRVEQDRLQAKASANRRRYLHDHERTAEELDREYREWQAQRAMSFGLSTEAFSL